jgi:hypothetical protein
VSLETGGAQTLFDNGRNISRRQSLAGDATAASYSSKERTARDARDLEPVLHKTARENDIPEGNSDYGAHARLVGFASPNGYAQAIRIKLYVANIQASDFTPAQGGTEADC